MAIRTCLVFVNLLSKTNGFIKNDKFANTKWKGVKSEEIKVFLLVCSKYLSSWTGPDMTIVIHVFPLVCFLVYGVKRRQVLIAKPRFYFYFSDFTPFTCLLSILLILMKSHKIVNKNIKGIKSIKKYKRGFAIRTCLLLTP